MPPPLPVYSISHRNTLKAATNFSIIVRLCGELLHPEAPLPPEGITRAALILPSVAGLAAQCSLIRLSLKESRIERDAKEDVLLGNWRVNSPVNPEDKFVARRLPLTNLDAIQGQVEGTHHLVGRIGP